MPKKGRFKGREKDNYGSSDRDIASWGSSFKNRRVCNHNDNDEKIGLIFLAALMSCSENNSDEDRDSARSRKMRQESEEINSEDKKTSSSRLVTIFILVVLVIGIYQLITCGLNVISYIFYLTSLPSLSGPY